jgi:hypothetical protein
MSQELKALIERQIEQTALGSRPVKDSLIAGLERYERRKRVVYSGTFALALVLFVVAIVVFYFDLSRGASGLVPITAGTGITAAAMFEVMRRAASEWTKADLLIRLARDSSEAKVRELMEQVIRVQ